jgi:hypothetical protein
MLESMLKRARVRLGKRVRFEGFPAILAGVACVVCAAGVAQALTKGATALPDLARETRKLWLAVRGERPSLGP